MSGKSAIKFKGPRSVFSNLYRIESGFKLWGQQFHTIEQAYQWKKCSIHGLHHKANKILTLSDPFRIKFEGTIPTNCEWDAMKYDLMFELLQIKFSVCPEFRSQLLLSFPRILVEDTASEYWGRGAQGQGKNVLGCMLVHLRSINLR